MPPKRHNAEINKRITLYCEGGIPTWSTVIEFRILRNGYSVWESDHESYHGRLVKVGGSKKRWAWRNAAEFLASRGVYGLSGDFLDSIYIEGIKGWQADILCMAWITEENPADFALEFLLGLDNFLVEYLGENLGSFIQDDALSTISELIDLIGEYAPEGNSNKILYELVIEKNHDLSKLIDELKIRLDEREKKHETLLLPFKKEIDVLIEGYVVFRPRPISGITNNRIWSQDRACFRSFVERYIVEHKELPRGIHRVPLYIGALKIDFGTLIT